MARRRMTAKQRRYFGPKRRTTRSYRRAPARRRASRGNKMIPFIAAGAYGAVRGRMSNMIAPYTSRIPAGNISDEVGMLAALWAVKKFGGRKIPVLGQVAKAGMLIESARIGEAVAMGQLGLGNNATNNNGGITISV